MIYPVLWSNSWLLDLGLKQVIIPFFEHYDIFLHCADNAAAPPRNSPQNDRLYCTRLQRLLTQPSVLGRDATTRNKKDLRWNNCTFFWHIRPQGLQSTESPYVTWSREMSHLSKISNSFFLHHFLVTSKCFILMQTPLQLDIWLQSYEGFVNAKNNIKQRNSNTVLPISQKQHLRHPTHSSWSCHIYGACSFS